MSSLRKTEEDIAHARACAALDKQVEEIESRRVPSPRDAEAEIAGALARAALQEQIEEQQSRQVPSLCDTPGLKALLYVTSNNATFNLLANLMLRSDIPVPENWVVDNGTVISVQKISGGYVVEMIHPEKVSNEKRFVTKEVMNAALAESKHKHLDFPFGKIVYVVRHGQARHNLPETGVDEARDADLTPVGIEQAIDCGKAIAKHALDHSVVELKIRFSDLIRTIQTAYHIANMFPEHMRPTHGKVVIEAHEATRPIGGKHHFQFENPLRRIAMDPYAPIEALRELAPGKTDAEIERMRVENCSKCDPISNPEGYIRRIGDGKYFLEIDWTDYIAKVQKAKDEDKTFGDAATVELLLDVILQDARE